jgi:hypothetical protein
MEEKKILSATQLAEMFQDRRFAAWANDLDERAEKYAREEKAREAARPQGSNQGRYGYDYRK